MSKMNLSDEVKVANYFTTNYDKLKHLSSVAAVDIVRTDTGVTGTRDQLKRIARDLNLMLFTTGLRRSKKFNKTSLHDVAAILGKCIQQIADEAGVKLHQQDRLTAIISRNINDLL